MYFKTISLHSVPMNVLADHYTTFLTLFNCSWLHFSFVSSYEMSSYLKYLSILHGKFFSLSVILWFRADIRIGCFFYFSLFSIFCKRKSVPEIFCVRRRRSPFIILVVLWFQEWPFLRFFRRPSVVSAPVWMTSYVISHMSNSNRSTRVTPISKDHVVVFIIVYRRS